MVLDDRRDEAEPGIGSVDPHRIHTVKKKLQGIAKDSRLRIIILMIIILIIIILAAFCCCCLFCCCPQQRCAMRRPLRRSLRVAFRSLGALDHVNNARDEPRAAFPSIRPRLALLLDEIHIDRLHDTRLVHRARKIRDTIANLGQNTEDARVARRRELQVTDKRVPKRPVKR